MNLRNTAEGGAQTRYLFRCRRVHYPLGHRKSTSFDARQLGVLNSADMGRESPLYHEADCPQNIVLSCETANIMFSSEDNVFIIATSYFVVAVLNLQLPVVN